MLALIDSAPAQSLDQTILLLISPGYYKQVLQEGKPYTLRELSAYRSSLTIQITIRSACAVEIQYDEHDGTGLSRLNMKLDFARALGLDFSGASRPGVVIRGTDRMLCQNYPYEAERCSSEFWPLDFTADIFSKQDSWQYTDHLKHEYQRTFDYFQSIFCKSKANRR